MFEYFKNKFLYANKYKTHSEAVIISCYFNPQQSPYRRKAFKHFYDSIKHLNHRIIECVIGDATPELPENENITRVYTKNLLWHKESLLNKIISELPEKYKYVFWVDADVIFTNLNWLPEAVDKLQYCTIIQPFEYCFHLDQDELKPGATIERNIDNIKALATNPKLKHPKVWRSFCANWTDKRHAAISENYDEHGHVGFAWGAKRKIIEKIPLYDKALIGGADHIIAHAAVGQINHQCIKKSFTEELDEIKRWSQKFFLETMGLVGYVQGDLYHIWHGDIANRQYLKRIVDFTPKTKKITDKDENGLYITDDQDVMDYMSSYYMTREVLNIEDEIIHRKHHHEYHSSSDSLLKHDDVNESTIIIPVDSVINETHHEHHGHGHSHDHNHDSHLNENFS
jgi:hypothetical protein